MKSDRVYCEQILDAVEKIHLFVEGIDKAGFLKDQKTQSAVIMQLAADRGACQASLHRYQISSERPIEGNCRIS